MVKQATYNPAVIWAHEGLFWRYYTGFSIGVDRQAVKPCSCQCTHPLPSQSSDISTCVFGGGGGADDGVCGVGGIGVGDGAVSVGGWL